MEPGADRFWNLPFRRIPASPAHRPAEATACSVRPGAAAALTHAQALVGWVALQTQIAIDMPIATGTSTARSNGYRPPARRC